MILMSSSVQLLYVKVQNLLLWKTTCDVQRGVVRFVAGEAQTTSKLSPYASPGEKYLTLD